MAIFEGSEMTVVKPGEAIPLKWSDASVQILNEMEYRPAENKYCVDLAKGESNGHLFVVRSYGSHPCCYVSVPIGKAINTDAIRCHGGITYTGKHLPDEETDDIYNWWIGWDYAHLGDYLCATSREPIEGERCWTTLELVDDCLKVIAQLK